jgi:polysaccharide export outer membrane protein
MQRRLGKTLAYPLAFAMLALVASCSTEPPPQPEQTQTGLISDPVLGVPDTGARCEIPAVTALWHRRSSTPVEDYPLGPGDQLTVSVPEVEELQNQHVRISQDGTIGLPLIGTVEIGGLTEGEAREVISQRLARFMKAPRVELYVESYRSRAVAVEGAVQKPGVYDLATFDDTLNDMIALAGGLAPTAAQSAIFLPAGVNQRSISTTPDNSHSETIAPVLASNSAPEAYDALLARRLWMTLPLGRSGDVGCLNLPARPGDVVLIPTAGNVTVTGWVRNPGSYPISPGMTVLGAVTAAGGGLFTWHAEVLRSDQTGSRVIKRLSLTDLQSGRETDIPVAAGDVVLLEKSVVGAVPYALLTLFQRFGTGVGMGIPF